MEIALLIGLAALPVGVLCWYVYHHDQKAESVGQLLKSFFIGWLTVPIAIILALLIEHLVDIYSGDGLIVSLKIAFLSAAVPEEISKLFILWLLLRKNKHFDEYYDGIVYAVMVGMGFAFVENVMYLFEHYDTWVSVGLLRALLSVPGHYAFAVLMGFYFSLWHFCKGKQRRRYAVMMLLIPVLLHGTFDAILFGINLDDSGVGVLLGIVFFVFCYKMHKFAKPKIENLKLRDQSRKEDWNMFE